MLSGHPWKHKLGSLVSSVKSNVDRRVEEARLAKEARAQGKVLDPDTKEWVFYLLDEELIKIEEELKTKAAAEDATDGKTAGAATSSSTTSSSSVPLEERHVADREYYDLLHISTNADASDIKKAYYKMARLCHPDKKPNDPTAHEEFQKLGHAYQVLSNPQTRDYYDKHGPKASSDSQQMEHEIDPMIFFNVMFGSASLEPYIGELWIAQASDSLVNDKATQQMMEDLEQVADEVERNRIMQERFRVVEEINSLKQRKRQIKCAINFRNRIQPYLEAQERVTWIQDHVHKWELSVVEEAEKIAHGAFGSLYCKTIGWTLMSCAEQYLAFETDNSDFGQRMAGYASRAKQTGSTIGSNWKLLGATVKVASAGHKAMRHAESVQQRMMEQEAYGMEVDESEAANAIAETMDETLPAILEFTWAINKRDIQNTLKEVFNKLLADNTLTKPDRRYRAEAMLIFGRQFYDAGRRAELSGKSADFDADDLKARVAAATMTTMASAQGQEVSATDAEDMIQQARQMRLDEIRAGGKGNVGKVGGGGGDDDRGKAASDER